MKWVGTPWGLAFGLAVGICFAIPARASLQQILSAALRHSPALQAAADAEAVARLKIELARTGYWPTLQAEAVASQGFPGSTGVLGIGGIMGSPYRSGLGYGLVLSQTLLDFGKTGRGIERARSEAELQTARTGLEENEILQAALNLYVDCALADEQKNNWSVLKKAASLIRQEVDRFVHTGQRSVVDSYLVRAQVDEASRQIDRFDEEARGLKRGLAVLTGLRESEIACPRVEALSDQELAAFRSGEQALLKVARLETQSAQARLQEARAGYLPKIVAVGSVGRDEDARLVSRQDYAVGVGVILPLFDAGKTNAEVDSARIELARKNHQQESARQTVDLINSRFDTALAALNAEESDLKTQLETARQAYQQARQRYLAMKGGLADLRESVRNLAKAETDWTDHRAKLYKAKALKAIFNGIGLL